MTDSDSDRLSPTDPSPPEAQSRPDGRLSVGLPANKTWGVPNVNAKIMIVDDAGCVVKMVHDHLHNAGYNHLITTMEPTKALDMVRRENPDLILLDIVMPKISGLEILRQVRADEQLSYIPVIILTDDDDQQTKAKALKLGATDFLAKPVNVADLEPRVQHALTLKTRHDHLEELTQANQQLQRELPKRERAEEALRQSEEKFRTLADSAYDWEYWIGPDGQLIYVSPSCRRITGYAPDEFSDEPGLLERICHPDDSAAVASHLQVVRTSGEVLPLDFRIVTRSGEQRWIEHVCQPVHSPDRRYLGRRASNRDVTERERATREVHRQRALVEGINRVFEESLKCETEEDVARVCLKVAEDLTDSKFGFIGELNQNAKMDTIALSDPGWSACRMPKSEAAVVVRNMELRSYWGRVLNEGRPIIVNDPQSHPDRVGTPEGHPPLTSFMGVPLERSGRTLGMIALANKPFGYSLVDQEVVESLAFAFVEALTRKQAEEATRRSEQRYRRITSAVTDYLFTVRVENGRPAETVHSPTSVAVTGYRCEEFATVPDLWIRMVHEDDRDAVRKQAAAILAGDDSGALEHRIVRKDGAVRWVRNTPSLQYDVQGNVAAYDGLISDITERKQAEIQLEGYVAALESANTTLEESNVAAHAASRAKSEFLSNMSHELRTPMNSVIGFTKRLLRKKKVGDSMSEQDVDALETVDRNTRHLLALINDVLDLSKIEAGKMELHPAKFDLVAVIREVAAQVAPLAEAKTLRLETELPKQPVMIEADRVKIVQVVTNLVSNGIKYSDEGSVTIAVCPTQDKRLGPAARISVRDTGIGIKPEDQRRLFTKFTQLDGSVSRHVGGTGLGLYISAQYIQMHGGRIGVTSEYGKGSEFTVLLPTESSHEASAAEDTTPPERVARAESPPVAQHSASEGEAARFGGITILCVDDEPDILKFMHLTFEDAGYNVLLAEGHDSAIEQAQSHSPDLICLDIHMPGKNGYEVMETLHGDPALASVPVVVVSVGTSEAKALGAGALRYVAKPVDAEHLVSVVRDVLVGEVTEVLIVEDDPDTLRLLTGTLDRRGIAVRTAANGQEALSQLAESVPSAILLDLMMPVMDGFTVLQRIQDHPVWKEIPVIVLTAKTLDTEDVEKLSTQSEAILTKGQADTERLIDEILNAVLSRRRNLEEVPV